VCFFNGGVQYAIKNIKNPMDHSSAGVEIFYITVHTKSVGKTVNVYLIKIIGGALQ